jgi:general stress protein 26
MNSDTNLKFIRERIYEIRSALIYSMSNSLIKLPTSIVTALNVDEDGQVWFLINRPLRHLNEQESEFPAKLQFYRKGKPFYMHVSGKAQIVNSEFMVNKLVEAKQNIKDLAMGHLALMKMKITTVDYCETISEKSKKNSVQTLLRQVYHWLFEPTPAMGTFNINTNAA